MSNMNKRIRGDDPISLYQNLRSSSKSPLHDGQFAIV